MPQFGQNTPHFYLESSCCVNTLFEGWQFLIHALCFRASSWSSVWVHFACFEAFFSLFCSYLHRWEHFLTLLVPFLWTSQAHRGSRIDDPTGHLSSTYQCSEDFCPQMLTPSLPLWSLCSIDFKLALVGFVVRLPINGGPHSFIRWY